MKNLVHCPEKLKNHPIKRLANIYHKNEPLIRNTVQNWNEIKNLFSEIELFSDIAEILDELIYNFGSLHKPFFDKDRDGFSAVKKGQLSGGLRRVSI